LLHTNITCHQKTATASANVEFQTPENPELSIDGFNEPGVCCCWLTISQYDIRVNFLIQQYRNTILKPENQK
jgi:hypothetical protein